MFLSIFKKMGGVSQEPRQKRNQMPLALDMKEVYAALDDVSGKILDELADADVGSCRTCICISRRAAVEKSIPLELENTADHHGWVSYVLVQEVFTRVNPRALIQTPMMTRPSSISNSFACIAVEVPGMFRCREVNEIS